MISLNLNTSDPLIMHIDLNSCFSTIEQQANRLLRNKPVGVTAYDSPHGFVLAASYPAKAKGVKLGVNCGEAKQLAPGIVIMTPDPSKYREAHKRFRKILLNYTSKITPKSIDEFVLDLSGSPAIRSGLSMQQIGNKIKQDIYQSLGEAVTVNVGIGPNRFLAKYAAGFNKPNGLTAINHANLEAYLCCGKPKAHSNPKEKCTQNKMNLIDLPGINTRYRRRLHSARIMNPLDFLNADERTLKKVVFKSVVGSYWYKRLRGWEVDNREFDRKTFGHQYALKQKTMEPADLEKILMKLCEKVGRRLRKNNYYAAGIHLYLGFEQLKEKIPAHLVYGSRVAGGFETMPYFKSWHKGRKLSARLYSSADIFLAAKQLLHEAEIPNNVKLMSVNVYNIEHWDPEQLNIFAEDRSLSASKNLSDAVDKINNRYGEFKITPATMADMQGTILDRVAFGSVKELG